MPFYVQYARSRLKWCEDKLKDLNMGSEAHRRTLEIMRDCKVLIRRLEVLQKKYHILSNIPRNEKAMLEAMYNELRYEKIPSLANIINESKNETNEKDI